MGDAPVAFASLCKSLKWLAHAGALCRLRFYKIVEQAGRTTYAVAPGADVASAIRGANLDLAADESIRFYRMFDGHKDLPDNKRAGLDRLLEFGPIGVIEFNPETGWLLT